MDNLFLQLETGQLLRILPISEDNIYEKFMFNYLKAREEFFIHEDNNFIPFGMYSQLHHRTERFFTVVDNGNELYIIKFGRKIKTMLDDYSSEDHLIPIDFILDNISLDVVVNMISITGGTVGNFDKCVVSRVICGANDYKSKDDYFLSDQYKSLMVLYNNYITKMRIENKPETLKYLNDNKLLQPQYSYLMRGIKINQIRQNKIDTTAYALWDKVDDLMSLSGDVDGVTDVGYSKTEKDEEYHQFMIDGYLFEIKMVDKIK